MYSGEHCTTQFALGVEIMEQKVIADTFRSILVYRNGILLPFGSPYVSGEVLDVTIGPFSFEVFIEARGLSI